MLAWVVELLFAHVSLLALLTRRDFYTIQVSYARRNMKPRWVEEAVRVDQDQ